MVWTVSDLSVVTGQLIGVLQSAISAFFTENPTIPQFNIQVSGNAPETVRTDTGCQLSLYLLHVSRDPNWRNTTVVTDPRTGELRVTSLPVGSASSRVSNPPPLPTNLQQPLSLNLSYLLTAFAGTSFQQEQQAMSIALRAFHQTPIFKTVPPDPPEELTIQVEADSIEEMSRFWQAVTVPIRLSALFRVAVVFLKPSGTTPAAALPPKQVQVAVGADFGAGQAPQLFQAAADIPYVVKPPPDNTVTPVFPPLAFVAQQEVSIGGVVVGGVGLSQVGAGQTFTLRLQVPAPPPNQPSTFWDVSNWILPLPPTAAPTDTVLRLALPAGYYATNPAGGSGVQLANTPVPGVYALVVVSSAVQSNGLPVSTSIPLPFAIAPTVTPPSGVTFPAKLSIASGLYTVQGAGFAPNSSTLVQTRVVLDTVPLAFTTTSPPTAGQFTIDPTGTQIQFLPPSDLPRGTYFVRVRVNGVDAPPNWFITVPPS